MGWLMSSASVGTAHQGVRRQTRIEGLARTLNARDRQGAGIEQPKLNQHGSLVPVNMLVGQFAFSESNDRHQWHFNSLSRRSNAWQHPVHPDGMRELKYHFIYQLIVADGPRDGGHLRIGRHLRNETLGVKLAELILAHTASQHWDVVDISVLDHGGKRLLMVPSVELMPHMLLPELLQSFLGGREICV